MSGTWRGGGLGRWMARSGVGVGGAVGGGGRVARLGGGQGSAVGGGGIEDHTDLSLHPIGRTPFAPPESSSF